VKQHQKYSIRTYAVEEQNKLWQRLWIQFMV